MQYAMYYEEQQQISQDEYGKMKQQILLREGERKFESYTLRKLKFTGNDADETVAHYYLCVKDQSEQQIYLEKKYMQNHIWHRACAKVTKESCGQILRGEIDWMKNSKEALFRDFYLQATLNHLSPGRVIEYQREMLKCKDGYVMFNKKINCIVGGWGNLFWPEAMSIHCLDEDKVLVVYKKKVNLPIGQLIAYGYTKNAQALQPEHFLYIK